MGMTRQERAALHNKQEKTHIRSGTPVAGDLRDGVYEVRYITGTGLVEFIKHNGILYKKVLDRA